jgi:3-dehydroquinate synthase
MRRLDVNLGARGYPVLIGAGLLGDADDWAPQLGTRSLIVTSETVAGLYVDRVREALGKHPHAVHVLPDGDSAKSLDHVERIVSAALDAGVARDGTFIALGGGAVGDVTGFAAAVYQRGVGYIQAPTTLLAQLDSAVGGKTAVNHPLGKNLVGAFHQPRCVITDVDTLKTLPPRELRAGLAEAIKYALLEGESLFDRLDAMMPRLLEAEPEATTELVHRCCSIKARFVEHDETDHGERALLNLGHSFGHAIESAYAGKLLHGEAVAIGCVMAASLSRALGWLEPGLFGRIEGVFRAAGLPVGLPAPAPAAAEIIERMQRDKKVTDGVLKLVLLHRLGQAELTGDYPYAALVLTVREFVEAAG